jgi:hypothetical protein
LILLDLPIPRQIYQEMTKEGRLYVIARATPSHALTH